VAAGLRAAVLRDTARVATAADAGDLNQVLASARAALDAMRGLLNGLREEPAGERDPQPTTAALPALADRWRAGGRRLDLEVRGAGRALPADVDLSAFRVVELLLAGDTGPATVRVDLTGDPLRITIRPMPPDESGELAASLRARLAAVGGTTTTAPDGLPELHLPAPVPAPPSAPPQAAAVTSRATPAAVRSAYSDENRPDDLPAVLTHAGRSEAAGTEGSSGPVGAAGPVSLPGSHSAADPPGKPPTTADPPSAPDPRGGPPSAPDPRGGPPSAPDPRGGPLNAADPLCGGGSRAGTISAGNEPGLPAGDDKEVASSPSG
jgi:hypothetical protein